MHDCNPRVVSDYITHVMEKNPTFAFFKLSLHPKDVEDLHLSITSRLPTDSNSTVKLHVGDDQLGDLLFARRHHTSNKMGKDNELFTPQTHNAHTPIPLPERHTRTYP